MINKPLGLSDQQNSSILDVNKVEIFGRQILIFSRTQFSCVIPRDGNFPLTNVFGGENALSADFGRGYFDHSAPLEGVFLGVAV